MMDKITLERIEKAHPKIREELKQQYLEINSILPKNARLRFASVYRTPEEQAKLFKQRPKVTNANSWQSMHQYGVAFDIVMLYDNDNNGKFEEASWDLKKDINKDGTPEWRLVIAYFESKGWEWAGRWKSFPEAPHFQKAFGLTWQQMKKRIDTGQSFINNGIRYINL